MSGVEVIMTYCTATEVVSASYKPTCGTGVIGVVVDHPGRFLLCAKSVDDRFSIVAR